MQLHTGSHLVSVWFKMVCCLLFCVPRWPGLAQLWCQQGYLSLSSGCVQSWWPLRVCVSHSSRFCCDVTQAWSTLIGLAGTMPKRFSPGLRSWAQLESMEPWGMMQQEGGLVSHHNQLEDYFTCFTWRVFTYTTNVSFICARSTSTPSWFVHPCVSQYLLSTHTLHLVASVGATEYILSNTNKLTNHKNK